MAGAVRYRRETGWPVAKVDDDVQARTGGRSPTVSALRHALGGLGCRWGGERGPTKRDNYEELINSGSYCGPDERAVQPSSGATGSVHM
jgi:uncharacterized protein YodC (DUF2158 family)